MKSFKDYLPLVVSVTVILVIGLVGLPAVADETTTPVVSLQDDKIPESQIQKWPGFFDCGETGFILDFVQGTQQENSLLQGSGVIQIPPGADSKDIRLLKSWMVLYFNPETGTWSMVSHFQNGYSCILLFGGTLAPASGDKFKKKIKEGLKKYQKDQDSSTKPEIKTIDHDHRDALAYWIDWLITNNATGLYPFDGKYLGNERQYVLQYKK